MKRISTPLLCCCLLLACMYHVACTHERKTSAAAFSELHAPLACVWCGPCCAVLGLRRRCHKVGHCHTGELPYYVSPPPSVQKGCVFIHTYHYILLLLLLLYKNIAHLEHRAASFVRERRTTAVDCCTMYDRLIVVYSCCIGSKCCCCIDRCLSLKIRTHTYIYAYLYMLL